MFFNSMSDTFNLQRFVDAQNSVYQNVLAELKQAKKQTHWMWFIFPQLKGLGKSQMSGFYGISGVEEACAYLSYNVLGSRYNECLKILNETNISNPVKIFGHTDSKKLQSSLTLFSIADRDNVLIMNTLNKFYSGMSDYSTEKMLDKI
jgi:uncharacterized protein (DUF1810 family)